MADIVKGLNAGKLQLPDRVAGLIQEYWTASGRSLTAYRDLAQHHAVVSSDARIAVHPEGHCFVHLVLPKNPETKAVAQLDYAEPYRYALPYLADLFDHLLIFFYELTHVLLSYTQVPRFEQLVFRFKGGLSLGVGAQLGHRLIRSEEIMERVAALTTKLRDRLDVELPRTDILPTLRISDAAE